MSGTTSIPIGKGFEFRGVRGVLAVLVLGRDRMTLHITLHPCPGEFLEEWLHGTRRVWRATDDLGTCYETVGVRTKGNDESCVLSIDWWPAPPPRTGSVTLEARSEDSVLLAHRIGLDPYR